VLLVNGAGSTEVLVFGASGGDTLKVAVGGRLSADTPRSGFFVTMEGLAKIKAKRNTLYMGTDRSAMLPKILAHLIFKLMPAWVYKRTEATDPDCRDWQEMEELQQIFGEALQKVHRHQINPRETDRGILDRTKKIVGWKDPFGNHTGTARGGAFRFKKRISDPKNT